MWAAPPTLYIRLVAIKGRRHIHMDIRTYIYDSTLIEKSHTWGSHKGEGPMRPFVVVGTWNCFIALKLTLRLDHPGRLGS